MATKQGKKKGTKSPSSKSPKAFAWSVKAGEEAAKKQQVIKVGSDSNRRNTRTVTGIGKLIESQLRKTGDPELVDIYLLRAPLTIDDEREFYNFYLTGKVEDVERAIKTSDLLKDFDEDQKEAALNEIMEYAITPEVFEVITTAKPEDLENRILEQVQEDYNTAVEEYKRIKEEKKRNKESFDIALVPEVLHRWKNKEFVPIPKAEGKKKSTGKTRTRKTLKEYYNELTDDEEKLRTKVIDVSDIQEDTTGARYAAIPGNQARARKHGIPGIPVVSDNIDNLRFALENLFGNIDEYEEELEKVEEAIAKSPKKRTVKSKTKKSKKASPRKASPKKASPKKASPRKTSPKGKERSEEVEQSNVGRKIKSPGGRLNLPPRPKLTPGASSSRQVFTVPRGATGIGGKSRPFS
jgi:hypothetical protein